MRAERWLCQSCGKEWSHGADMGYTRVLKYDPATRQDESTPWTPDDGCPSCKEHDIGLVRFDAPFRGADIPRDRLQQCELIPYRRPST